MKRLILFIGFIALLSGNLSAQQNLIRNSFTGREKLQTNDLFVWQGDTIYKDSMAYIDWDAGQLRFRRFDGEWIDLSTGGAIGNVAYLDQINNFEAKNIFQDHVDIWGDLFTLGSGDFNYVSGDFFRTYDQTSRPATPNTGQGLYYSKAQRPFYSNNAAEYDLLAPLDSVANHLARIISLESLDLLEWSDTTDIATKYDLDTLRHNSLKEINPLEHIDWTSTGEDLFTMGSGDFDYVTINFIRTLDQSSRPFTPNTSQGAYYSKFQRPFYSNNAAEFDLLDAWDKKITSLGFDLATGIFTLNQQDGGSLTQGLDGRYGVLGAPLTPGSVLFAGVSGEISQSNSKFFWDNGTSQLVIGSLRPITLDGDDGWVNIKAASGGWNDAYRFSGSAGTNFGGFGAFGNDDVLEYWYIGSDWNSTNVKIYNTGDVSASGDVSGLTLTGTSLTDTYFPRVTTGGTLVNSILKHADATSISIGSTSNYFYGNHFKTISNSIPVYIEGGTSSGVQLIGNSQILLEAFYTGEVEIPNGGLTVAGNVGIKTSPITANSLVVQGDDTGRGQIRVTGSGTSSTDYWEFGRESASTGDFIFSSARSGVSSGALLLRMGISDVTGYVRIYNFGTSAGNFITESSGILQKRTATQVVTDLATPLDGAYLRLDASNDPVIGALSLSSNLTVGGYVDLTGLLYHRSNIRVLNKAETGWLTWATRNTSGAETVIDLGNIGTIKAKAPSTSAFAISALTSTSGSALLGGIYEMSGGHGQFIGYNSSNVATVAISSDGDSWLNGGNVGIGVTPSSWTTLTALQIKNAGLAGYANSMYLTQNNYYDGGWKYIASSYAAKIQMDGAGISFAVAPSGTAGNAVSFTDALVLDPTGNATLAGNITASYFKPTGSPIARSIGYSSVKGLIARGEAGSAYNFAIEDPSGVTVLSNPSGTHGVNINEFLDISGDVTFGGGSQDYLFTDRSTSLAIQGQNTGAGIGTFVEMFGDGVGDNYVGYRIFAKGVPTDISTYELLNIFHDYTTRAFTLRSYNAGSGTLLPIVLQAGSNTDQLKLNIDGSTSFSSTIQATTGLFTNLATGFIPYHVSDASGLANSPISVSVTSEVTAAVGSSNFIIKGADDGSGQLILRGNADANNYWELGRESAARGEFMIREWLSGAWVTTPRFLIARSTGNVAIGYLATASEATGNKLAVDGTVHIGGNSTFGGNLTTDGEIRVNGTNANAYVKLISNFSGSQPGIIVYNTSGVATFVHNANGGSLNNTGAVTFGSTLTVTGAAIAYSLEVGSQRPVYFGNGTAYMKGASGGWAFGWLFKGSAGTDLGGYGIFGQDDALNYWYIGTAYNSTNVKVYANGNMTVGGTLAVTGTISASNFSGSSSGNNTGDQDLSSYLTTESDPIFTAWDKSTGISITTSQISNYVVGIPYTGAGASADMGSFDFEANHLLADAYVKIGGTYYIGGNSTELTSSGDLDFASGKEIYYNNTKLRIQEPSAGINPVDWIGDDNQVPTREAIHRYGDSRWGSGSFSSATSYTWTADQYHNDGVGVFFGTDEDYEVTGGTNTFSISNSSYVQLSLTSSGSYLYSPDGSNFIKISDTEVGLGLPSYIDGYLDVAEQSSSPSTPSSGWMRLYPKTDGYWYYKTDGGTEYKLDRTVVPSMPQPGPHPPSSEDWDQRAEDIKSGNIYTLYQVEYDREFKKKRTVSIFYEYGTIRHKIPGKWKKVGLLHRLIVL